MKRFTTQKQKIGEIGEYVAKMFLVKHGFMIVEKNFTRKIGEIDIIAKKDLKLHFIEVKSVSCKTIDDISSAGSVCRETLKILPEEQFHVKKFRRFARAVEMYLLEKNVPRETDWHIDLLTVYIDTNKRQGKVVPFWNVVRN